MKPHLLPAFPFTLRIHGWSSALNSRVTIPNFFLRASSLCFLPNSLPAAPSGVSSSPYILRLLRSRSIRAWGQQEEKTRTKEKGKRRRRRRRVNRQVEKLKRKKVRYGWGLDCLFRKRQEEMLQFYITTETYRNVFHSNPTRPWRNIFSLNIFSQNELILLVKIWTHFNHSTSAQSEVYISYLSPCRTVHFVSGIKSHDAVPLTRVPVGQRHVRNHHCHTWTVWGVWGSGVTVFSCNQCLRSVCF